MKFSITKGRLDGVRFKLANSYSKSPLKPTAIVLHDTAGRLDKFSSVNWFCDRTCKTSAHITVERDGTVTQQVPLDQRAYHAGKSSWGGKTFCNSFTIGIEIVNPGALEANGSSWFHVKFPTDQLHATPKAFQKSHGSALWMDYTEEQITAVKGLCRAIFEEYPDCNEILTHYLISPGRKVDVNPLFPLNEVRRYAEGHDDAPLPPSDKPAVMPPPVVAQPQAPLPGPAMSVADLKTTSSKVSFLVWMRRGVYSVFGGLSLASVSDALQFTKGVFNDVSTFIHDQALVLAVGSLFVGAASITWLIGRHQKDVAEGRYVPSKSYDPHPALPGPRDDEDPDMVQA